MLEYQQSLVAEQKEREKDMNINSAFKSNYLKHTDLAGKRVIVTMERVEIETVGQGQEAEEKPVLYFKGHDRGLVLNKTNAYSISEIVGSEETDEWAGHRIVLHPDKTMYGGKKVDCIRVAVPPAAPNGGNGSRRPAPPPPPPVEEEVSEGFVASDEDVPF